MANVTQHLTSVSLDSRSGSPPGRRLLALTLVGMLVLGSVFPGFALAGEGDSEGEGTVPPVEVPVDPGFDPGGEEEALEEAPAAGGDAESGAVEPEPEVDPVPPEAGTGVAAEAPVESEAPQTASTPESVVPAPASEAETTQQAAAEEPESAEPVANQSIAAPPQKSGDPHTAATTTTSSETAPPTETSEDTSPAPSPVPATAPNDVPRRVAGRDSYVVRPGDCLWHIAAALLPAEANDAQIVGEVARLWQLNESRIGTGDPSLIYAGTELRLR